MSKREVYINRDTKETSIKLALNLDGSGLNNIDTGIGFFNHMLQLLAFHSLFDIDLKCNGDLDVCDHHSVEDIGISFGKAIEEALGEKRGIRRYSTVFLPMDESLIMVALDISGRGFLHFEGDFKRDSIGNFSTEMVKEFLRAIAMNAGITLHVRILYGENDHHKIEAIFKALGRALKEAVELIYDESYVPSSKGTLV